MPLHLLGKKSWNVYNQDNIEKVRRDEAAAKAREEAAEERMQEADAQRRLAVLRGEVPIPLPVEELVDEEHKRESQPRVDGREKRKRKRFGEDDTDFEIRIANERASLLSSDTQVVLRRPVEAPLTDHKGHIDLFPQEKPKDVERNPETEREAAKKRKEYEDQYMLKFSNAAGFKQGLDDPWYSKQGSEVSNLSPATKNVWGDDDPRRGVREAARITSNDPLAMMRQGAAQVRKVEKERKAWLEERTKEIADLKRAERKEHKRKRADDADDLEDFSLDRPEKESRVKDDEHRSRHKGSHRHSSRRHRSRSKDRCRKRHRSRH